MHKFDNVPWYSLLDPSSEKRLEKPIWVYKTGRRQQRVQCPVSESSDSPARHVRSGRWLLRGRALSMFGFAHSPLVDAVKRPYACTIDLVAHAQMHVESVGPKWQYIESC